MFYTVCVLQARASGAAGPLLQGDVVLLKIDFAVLDFIQSHLRTGAGDYLMPLISRLGDKGFIWIGAALILVLFRRTRRLGVTVTAALAIEIFLCNGLIKPLAARIRPYDINTGIQMLVARPTDYSFPSGHTAASFAAASALYFRRSGWCSHGAAGGADRPLPALSLRTLPNRRPRRRGAGHPQRLAGGTADRPCRRQKGQYTVTAKR